MTVAPTYNDPILAPPESPEAARAELLVIEQELRRRRWVRDPVLWAREKLGDVLWSGQVRILEAVRDHRKTAAATCHEIGKSYDAALLAAWWIDTHKIGEAYVVTTAPTNDQVRIILWKEIGRAHTRGELAGRVNETEWKIKIGEKEESVAIGRKPNDYAPAAFQGVHAPYVLVIVDEANGVRGQLHDALDSIIANDGSKLLMIGNPDDPSGEFFEACKPNSGFKVVHISAFDSPNFTGEPLPDDIKRQLIGKTYVEERRARWAPAWRWTPDGARCVPPPGGGLEDTHPFWQSKVLGQFPVQSAAGSLIPLQWIRAAQERALPAAGPSELGLDVGASAKGDPTCLGWRRGPVFRVLYEERQPDTMKSLGRAVQHFQNPLYDASCVKVDYIGVGRGIVDRAKEQGLPFHPVSVGEASTVCSCRICKHEWDQALLPTRRMANANARCPRCNSDQVMKVFANLLSQLWWQVRGLFERGEIDIDERDEQLAEELLTLSWEPNSKGQMVVKYSTTAPSPNRADALLFAHAPVPAGAELDFAAAGMTSSVTW